MINYLMKKGVTKTTMLWLTKAQAPGGFRIVDAETLKTCAVPVAIDLFLDAKQRAMGDPPSDRTVAIQSLALGLELDDVVEVTSPEAFTAFLIGLCQADYALSPWACCSMVSKHADRVLFDAFVAGCNLDPVAAEKYGSFC